MGNFGNEKGENKLYKYSEMKVQWERACLETAVSPRNNTTIHLWLGRSVVSRFWVVWPSFCSLVASPLTPPWQQTCQRCLWHSDNLNNYHWQHCYTLFSLARWNDESSFYTSIEFNFKVMISSKGPCITSLVLYLLMKNYPGWSIDINITHMYWDCW